MLHPSAQIGISLGSLVFLAALVGCGGGSQSGGGIVTPPKKTLTQIAISPNSPSVALGGNLQLTAMAAYSDGSHQDVTATASWQTDKTTVATVNTVGDLTAVGPGSAQVTAQYQGMSGATSVTVASATLVSVTVSPGQSSLPIGEVEQLAATSVYSDGSKAD